MFSGVRRILTLRERRFFGQIFVVTLAGPLLQFCKIREDNNSNCKSRSHGLTLIDTVSQDLSRKFVNR